MAVFIRRATLADIPAIAKVLSLSFYPRWGWFFPLWQWSIGLDLRWRFLDTNPRYVCLVAVNLLAPQPQILGTIELCTKTISNRKPNPYLFNLAVHPQWRRQGIARLLLLATEPIVKEWGFDQMCIHVMASNYPAQRLYSDCDYTTQQSDRVWGGVRLLLTKKL